VTLVHFGARSESLQSLNGPGEINVPVSIGGLVIEPPAKDAGAVRQQAMQQICNMVFLSN
jgi:hypothetical protein